MPFILGVAFLSSVNNKKDESSVLYTCPVFLPDHAKEAIIIFCHIGELVTGKIPRAPSRMRNHRLCLHSEDGCGQSDCRHSLRYMR